MASSSTESDGDEEFLEYEEASDSEESVFQDVDTSPIPDCEGIDRYGWSGKVLLARHGDGFDFAEVIIVTANPNACIDGETKKASWGTMTLASSSWKSITGIPVLEILAYASLFAICIMRV